MENNYEHQEAQAMADFIERWLGNPLARSALGFLTERCPKDGRRAERILEMYNGETNHLCTSCRISSVLVKKVLDMVLSRTDIDEEELKNYLGNPMWRKGLASVLEGIAEYGPKKPFTAYAPFLVVWNITRACNLRCRHCYEVAAVPGKDELNTEEALTAVDKMAEAGVAYIAISGGEPLVRKDLFEVAKRIREHGMAFSIATNATLLSKENVQKLKELECIFIQVSLNEQLPGPMTGSGEENPSKKPKKA